MDGSGLLQAVSNRYRSLRTLESRALAISENRDNGFHRSEQPVRFFFVAPNQIRLDHGGQGMFTVSDGRDLHIFFPGPNRYSKRPLPTPHPLPGFFNPLHPGTSGNSAFLFQNVTERMVSAEILRRETLKLEDTEAECDVVEVTYEPSSSSGIVLRGSPLLFWIHTGNRMVIRSECEVTLQFPSRLHPQTTKHILALTHLSADVPIEPSVFEFQPPAGAEAMPSNRGMILGGGGGSFQKGGDGKLRGGHWRQNWEGDTLVERSKISLHGHEITVERRWTVSADKNELQISERIVGPTGPIEQTRSIRLT